MSDGRATKTKQTFRMQCGVSINIRAKPEKIWSLLTNAAEFPRWNSTVQSIEGQIALGQRIRLRVPIAPKRVFKLKVSELEAGKRMLWQDGAAPMFKGVRTFTLSPRDDGSVEFSMEEVFSGLMLPMIAGSLPDFAPSFERYAADLKRAAEQNGRGDA
jgi:uncharacterized protein YndB with AHSA1/START domain